MALQDVCGFHDAPLYPRWNSPASLSSPVANSNLYFNISDESGFSWRAPSEKNSGSVPLRFSMPPQQSSAGWFCKDPAFTLLPPSAVSSPSSLRPFPLSHGTTTLGFVFQGGVIAAADTRSSCAGLVACPASQKILPIHSHLVLTTSGSSADCMLWERILAREMRLYQLRHRRRLTVSGAAKLLSHMLHPFKGTDVCVAAILCGWDGEGKGGEEEETEQSSSSKAEEGDSLAPVLHTETTKSEHRPFVVQLQPDQRTRGVDGGRMPAVPDPARSQTTVGGGHSGPSMSYVCSDGTLLRGELFSVGSGSPYAYSVLDGGVRWGMSVEEAVSLAREAVYRATHRDAYSGNSVDLFHITARGWSRRDREELKEEYYREKERERERMREREKEREREES